MSKFDTFLEKTNELLEQAADFVSNQYENVSEAVSNRIRYAESVGQADTLVKQLGEMVYRDHVAGQDILEKNYKESLKELDNLMAEIEELEEAWEAANKNCCPECGSEIDETMRYCPSCGHDLKVTKCKSCGEPVKDDAAFCHKCGNKL